LTVQDTVVNLVLSVVLIVGAYQFYFFTQRHPWREARSFHSPLDERIPFVPAWSWVYSFLYYPAILYLNLLADTPGAFTRMAFSFILLLALQMACFTVFPVATPAHWRARTRALAEARAQRGASAASLRFLDFVRHFDGPANCFPSMHVSVATLTALHASAALGPWAWAFPALIAASCLFTKQHYLIDLPFGAALGAAAFALHRHWLGL